MFILAFVTLAGWLASRAVRPAPLSAGDPMPAIAYETPTGGASFEPSGSAPGLVVLFHSMCGHCHYQLDRFEKAVARLEGLELFLFTAEDSLPMWSIRERWPSLAAADNVVWGTVSGEVFEREFGTLTTPAFFVYDARGNLRHVSVGEATVDFLLARLRG